MHALTQVLETFVLAQAAEPSSGGGGFGLLPLFMIIGAMFYILILRPDQKRRKRQDQMLTSLKKNDRILTNSGIYGTVVNIHADAGDITIKVDENSNTRMKITRSSIGQLIKEGEDEGKNA